MARRVERPAEVHPDHRIPVLPGQVEHHAVPQDPRHVDQHVQFPVGVDGLANQRLRLVEVTDIGPVGDRLTTILLDLLHHLTGRALVAARPIHRSPKVVDDDLRPLLGEQPGHPGADTSSGPRHDRNPSVQRSCHASLPFSK